MKFIRLTAALLAAFAPAAFADAVTVSQKNKSFSEAAVRIQAGDTVVFKNEDAFYHNIFSLSGTEVFDLGSFGEGESREHRFESPGHYEVECAIHPEMKMVVDVQ